MLTACAGSLFKSKVAPPTMYLLSAESPSVASSPRINADLAVLRPQVRAGLDTERIAALYPDRRLDYFADARWSGQLAEVIQDLAVQEFHSSAALRNVSADASAFTSAYWLELDVADFQAEYSAAAAAPTVHVRIFARMGDSADRRIVARYEADEREVASENRMTAIIQAYDRAVDRALEKIAEDAAQTLEAAVRNTKRGS